MLSEIIIWTEGGPSIGMGHIARCITLASELSKAGRKPSFIVNPDEIAGKRLLMEGFAFITNSFDSKFTDSSLNILNDAKIVIFDTLRDVGGIVKLLSAKGIKVVLIDNTTAASKFVDLVIIPSVIALSSGPSADDNAKLFSGADYLMLGENFIEGRGADPAASHATPLRVLVTFGASDPFGLTSLVVEALCIMEELDITVVIGEGFTNRDPYSYSAGCKHVRCVSGLTDLAPLMKEAHVAFTANGTSIYELAFMGTPSMIIANYEKDLRELNAFQQLGFSLGLGLFSKVTPKIIQSAVKKFMDKEFYEDSSKKGMALTDGLGAKRAVELIVPLHGGK